jgi:CDP-glucose 4,6-dehydratase
MEQRPGEVEEMVIARGFWAGRRVLITGHTGFKGGWMSLLLASLGANVYGFALPGDNQGVFAAARVQEGMGHRLGDVRDGGHVAAAFDEAQPEIVIHMAAQALVRRSYAEPVATYATNVMGTVNVLEAARHIPNVRAIVIVTSDKCYENVGSIWGYRETDRLGGSDPYSNSKGCAELVADSYRRSFFHEDGAARVATARAGNVIGGGDRATDRLVPDAIRAFSQRQPLRIRNPFAVRPWQHVLDPVLAYLSLAERLASGPSYDQGWNFGPTAASEVPVRHIVDRLVLLWGGTASWELDRGDHVREATYLKLDCTKATTHLGWRPVIELDEALRMTVEWYRAKDDGRDMRGFTLGQIESILGRTQTYADTSARGPTVTEPEPDRSRSIRGT